MANRDKTGPEGQGPRTGRQLGDCKEAIQNRPRLGQRGRLGRNRR